MTSRWLPLSLIVATTALAVSACATKETMVRALDLTPPPSHIALQKGRYMRAKGIPCSRVPWPTIPTISLGKDDTQVTLQVHNYPHMDNRQWTIPKVDGDYDWGSTQKALLEVQTVLKKSGALRPPEFEDQFYEIEISADEDVRYLSVLNAIDLVVANGFADFAYIDPSPISLEPFRMDVTL